VEFLRAAVSNVVAKDDYFKWTSVQQYQSLDNLFENKFVELVNFLKQLYSIDVAREESEDVKLAMEFAERWSKDRDVIKRVAFDMLLLAQAVRGGVKLFMRDWKLFEIREKMLQPPPPKPGSVGGVRITYDDPYVLYVAYLA
jgi:hypothetical protein